MSNGRQLISCPECASGLIQIECCESIGQDRSLLERYCPECGHRDELAVTNAVADILNLHASELAASLRVLADRLQATGELWISR